MTTKTSLMIGLERLLAQGRDDALLRYGLGVEYLKAGEPDTATMHLRAAVGHAADYSAAWKLLGQALTVAGDHPGAGAAYRQGIVAAESKGDIQAAKEMRVFLRRLERTATGDEDGQP